MLIGLFGIIIGIVALDQITKIVFINVNYSVIGDFLWFFSTQNDGAAFSMLQGGRWWFIAISIPVIAVLLYLMISGKMFKSKFFKVTLAIMIGGIIGNLIDRIAFGYVRDFIYLKFINFAVFNIADIALTVSCIMLVIFVIFLSGKEDKNKEKTLKSKTKIDGKL